MSKTTRRRTSSKSASVRLDLPRRKSLTNCSHHALTLAIDGKLYMAPLERDRIKVSCHFSWPDEPLG